MCVLCVSCVFYLNLIRYDSPSNDVEPLQESLEQLSGRAGRTYQYEANRTHFLLFLGCMLMKITMNCNILRAGSSHTNLLLGCVQDRL